MNNNYPVFTRENVCHDCYKCIRQCPVKAIRIENSHASVISDKCIACGKCVKSCPQKAKKVRNDISRVKELLSSPKNVYISLAPSWAGIFNCDKYKIIFALKKLGFKDVSETALGAQEVSAKVAEMLSNADKGLFVSSACPVIVDYIRLYKSDYVKYITPIASPALTHAKLLKKTYGEDISIVFIGPCIAKKNESDRHPELIDVSLTFSELALWLEEEGINLDKIEPVEKYDFVPEKAFEGQLYPIEGGMNETIKRFGENNAQLLNISSIMAFKDALNNLDIENLKKPVFIEALACEGGCTGGPCSNTNKAGIEIISDIISKTEYRDKMPEGPTVVVDEDYLPEETKSKHYTIEEILEAMHSIGKYSIEDELDCGGCGYDTCRNLAEALLSHEAEPSMCVSYMRHIAMQKANAMFRCMPSAVVIVNKDLKIIESNDAFAKMFASDIYEYFTSKSEGLAGAALERLIPCSDVFKKALKTQKDLHKERYPIKDKLYDITAFTIEPKQIVGAIITDVTKTEMKREQIAKKAQEVISKNIATVQNIACMLGEHMVETELLLSSIAEGYESDPDTEEDKTQS